MIFPDPTTLSPRALARASEGFSHPDCWGLDYEIERNRYKAELDKNGLDRAFALQQGRDISVDRAEEVRLAERLARKSGKTPRTVASQSGEEPEPKAVQVHEEQSSMFDEL